MSTKVWTELGEAATVSYIRKNEIDGGRTIVALAAKGSTVCRCTFEIFRLIRSDVISIPVLLKLALLKNQKLRPAAPSDHTK
jgi:hypothetical protein